MMARKATLTHCWWNLKTEPPYDPTIPLSGAYTLYTLYLTIDVYFCTIHKRKKIKANEWAVNRRYLYTMGFLFSQKEK